MGIGKLNNTPATVVAEQGVVLVDGPEGVALSFSPTAAEESGKRLIAAAQDAMKAAKQNEKA